MNINYQISWQNDEKMIKTNNKIIVMLCGKMMTIQQKSYKNKWWKKCNVVWQNDKVWHKCTFVRNIRQ